MVLIYARNFANAAKEALRRITRSVVYYKSLGILYPNVPWSCRPYRYSNIITCTDSTIEHTEDEGLGANILALRCVKWQKLELSCRTSIREKFISPRKYSLQQQNCVHLTFRNFPCHGSNGIAVTLFLFYTLVDIVIRFLDTDPSLLICLSVIEIKTEGNRHRDAHYS